MVKDSVIERVTQELLERYETRAQPATRLPERDRIICLIEIMSLLLFPGYYTSNSTRQYTEKYALSAGLSTLQKDLASVLERALSYPGALSDEERARAEQASDAFINELPKIRDVLMTDADAALMGDPAASSVDEVILTYPGFRAITIYRIAHWFYKNAMPFLPRMMTEYAHGLTGIDLHPGAQIGHHFFIDHGTGVVVGESTVIGNHVKLYQGVTLGAHSVDRKLAGNKRHPTLEDHVVIYAGATVLGGDTTIGEHSIIGGNVWLTASVPSCTRVLATPASLDFRVIDTRKISES